MLGRGAELCVVRAASVCCMAALAVDSAVNSAVDSAVDSAVNSRCAVYNAVLASVRSYAVLCVSYAVMQCGRRMRPI